MRKRIKGNASLNIARVLLCTAILGTGCGGMAGSEAVTQAEIRAATAVADVASLQSDLDDQREVAADEFRRSDELESELVKIRAALTDERDRSTALTADLESVMQDLEAADRRADEAEQAIQAVLVRYDKEIRADAQTAWEAELAEACGEAGNGSSPIRRYVDHNDQLAIIGTEDELVELVAACADPFRSRTRQQRLDADCEAGSADAITRDPDGLKGSCFMMFVVPWQWDSRTGECNFLGSWDGSNLGLRRFDYDGDGLFRAPTDVCDESLSDADQGDLLQVWGTLQGPYRYDTAAGGTNEIPDFVLRHAVLVTKD